MTATIKNWLGKQLSELRQVRFCVIDPLDRNLTYVKWHPDILVRTWSGKEARCQLVARPLGTRDVRAIARQHTAIGSPTIFLVDLALLPAIDQVCTPAEWLRAIHALTNNRIYAYTCCGDVPRLYELRFEPTGIGSESRTVFVQEVFIGDIRFNRITPRERFVSGSWLIMTFGDGRQWDGAPGRAAFTEEGRRWKPGYTPRADTHLVNCYSLLEVEPGARRSEIKAAYRRMARKYHPDTSELPPDEAGIRFKEITEAYAAINRANGWD